MIHAVDFSFSAPDISHDWVQKQMAERDIKLFIGAAWTGNQHVPGCQRALAVIRECGATTGAYFVTHGWQHSHEWHYERAREVIGQEWEHLKVCAVDVEVEDANTTIEGIRRCQELVIEHGVPVSPIYTSWYKWQLITGGSHGCADLPWWPAQYDGVPDLGNVITYGGWRIPLGKQYTNTTDLDGIAVDFNVFDESILGGAMYEGEYGFWDLYDDMDRFVDSLPNGRVIVGAPKHQARYTDFTRAKVGSPVVGPVEGGTNVFVPSGGPLNDARMVYQLTENGRLESVKLDDGSWTTRFYPAQK